MMVMLTTVFVTSAMAAPEPVTKWDITAPVPNSAVDFYEACTGQPNPYAGEAESGDVHIEWSPPPPGEYDFSSRVNIPYMYNQGDPNWRYDIMQTRGRTIGSAGCALVSATMVFRRWGVNKDPHQFNIAMGGGACPFAWTDAPGFAGEGMVAKHARTPYIRFGWSYSDSMPASDWYNMAWALRRGLNPIVEVTRPDETTHWLVVVQVGGPPNYAGSYRVVDPNGGYERPLTDYTIGQSCHATSLVIYEPY